MSEGEMNEAIQEFLVESDENLSQVERDLVDFEGHPEQQETLASIFRAIHTIKGTCSFLGYSKLESLAHTGETLLSLVRDGELALSNEIASALLNMVDAVRHMLAAIEQTGNDGAEEYQDLKNVLVALQKSEQASIATEETERSVRDSEFLVVQDPSEYSVADQGSTSDVEESSVEDSLAPVLQPLSSSDKPKAEPPASVEETRGPSVADSSIRVDVGLLDKLMNMVGELVLTRNQIGQGLSKLEDPALLHASQRLSLITTELQEGIMKTRMQQIGNIWIKFPRVVRDLAMSCGKEVRIDMEGKETELDKTLIEAIKDPLTHLVRNSVDHGIETPTVRLERGKPREGRLLLRAYHEGGQVNIEITDDGGGINVERVVEIAVKKGLVTVEQTSTMSERELLGLVFQPGFSTAEKVTNVSGRGVGMDVVKTNIEKIGGTIDIQTKLGKGTTFKLKVPLTLAIIPALIITASHERFAIPQVSLLELVRLEGEQINKNIDMVPGASVCRLRETLLPLLHLSQIVGISPKDTGNEEAELGENVVNIVVLQADVQRFGLVVDEIIDTEEIVVRPLSKQLKGVPVFAGVTIMGDGRVALILDVLGLANCAGIAIQQAEGARIDQLVKVQDGKEHKDTLLIVKVSESGQLAIPLKMVARLEEIKKSSLEEACGKEVIQYRGEILPIIRLCQVLGTTESLAVDMSETLQMVVIAHGQRRIGLVVDRIVDIVDEFLEVKQVSTKSEILYSAVIQEHVTDVLNVQQLILDYAGLSAEKSVEKPEKEFVGV